MASPRIGARSIGSAIYPFAMMVNTYISWRNAELQRKQQEKFHKEELDFQKWRIEHEHEFQREMANYSRHTQLLLAREQRKTALELAEANRILENWPLSLFPSQLLTEVPDEGIMPLKILVAPPAISYDRLRLSPPASSSLPQEEQHLLADIRRFFECYYPLQSSSHPTELLEGSWVSGRFHGGASIKALHSLLQSQPFLLLEAVGNEESIELHVAYWGIVQERYWYRTLETTIPYKELMERSAKRRAFTWKQQREILLAKGYDKERLKAINRGGEENLAILELENPDLDVDLPYQLVVKPHCF